MEVANDGECRRAGWVVFGPPPREEEANDDGHANGDRDIGKKYRHRVYRTGVNKARRQDGEPRDWNGLMLKLKFGLKKGGGRGSTCRKNVFTLQGCDSIVC